MPILGIWASQISGHLWAPAGAYDALATVTVPSGGVASVSFAGIPTGYKHLQIRYIGRTNRANAVDQFNVTYNNDTGSNYYQTHYMYGDGSTVPTGANGVGTKNIFYRVTGASAGSNLFGVGIWDFLDYSNTNKYKTIRGFGGEDQNGSGEIWFQSGLWMSTAAITSIDISSNAGTGLSQYTQFALYGVK